MAWLDKINHPERYLKTFIKWGFFGLLMGVLGGLSEVDAHPKVEQTMMEKASRWAGRLEGSAKG